MASHVSLSVTTEKSKSLGAPLGLTKFVEAFKSHCYFSYNWNFIASCATFKQNL